MKRKKYSAEQIITILRDVEVMTTTDRTIHEACREKQIGVSTYHRWRQKYGGMSVDEAKRLKELEKENSRLKKLVANQALDIDMLQEVASGNF